MAASLAIYGFIRATASSHSAYVCRGFGAAFAVDLVLGFVEGIFWEMDGELEIGKSGGCLKLEVIAEPRDDCSSRRSDVTQYGAGMRS